MSGKKDAEIKKKVLNVSTLVPSQLNRRSNEGRSIVKDGGRMDSCDVEWRTGARHVKGTSRFHGMN